ncbi:MAG: 3'-5' exonuclease [Campylobacterales bacterium]|nr:3'-5' exonuclease [Campylobacterales bacterium]
MSRCKEFFMTIIFDIETVPDLELCKEFFDISSDGYDGVLQAQEQYKEENNTTFLPLPYHRVVEISAVQTDDFGDFKKVGSFSKSSEKELISEFFNLINKFNPRLVSFNGKNFDIPVLLLRGMKYNLSCQAFFDTNNPALNKSKWENYRVKFNESFHLDLYEQLSTFGANRTINLDTICKMCGAVGKIDTKGDDVARLFYANDLKQISEYCESDVLNTYWIFLKYELLKGNLSLESYKTYLKDMSSKLQPQKSYYLNFLDAVDIEINRS